MKTIKLCAIGKSVSLKAYVQAVKLAKENPNMMFKHSFECWWPVDGNQVIKEFRKGIHQRINEKQQ